MVNTNFSNAEWGARVYSCYARLKYHDAQDRPAIVLAGLLLDLRSFAAYQGVDFEACLAATDQGGAS